MREKGKKPKINLFLIVTLSVCFNLAGTKNEKNYCNMIDPPELNFSCINCNSLNMSLSSKSNQLKKIRGITSLESDIIFLSDTRLSNKNLVSAEQDVTALFRVTNNGNYDCYFNSKKNKRGVGILIKNYLKVEVQELRQDPEENFLLLRILVQGKILIIGAIYGPNNNDPAFFEKLSQSIRDLGNYPLLIGGDFNCTFSCDNDFNPDVINMQNPPNLTHSRLLRDLCNDFDLTDPFRVLYPNKTDFTFVPRRLDVKYRSRIDFFIVSENLIPVLLDVTIAPGLQNHLFDHKAVSLRLGSVKNKKVKKSQIVSHRTVTDELSEYIVHAATTECYLIHANEANFLRFEKDILLRRVGRLKKLIRDAGNTDTKDQREVLLGQINALKAGLNVSLMSEYILDPDPHLFMETLIFMVKNELISHQAFLAKKHKAKKIEIGKELNILKLNYRANFDRINLLERDLNLLLDSEMEEAMNTYSIFDNLNNEKITPAFLSIAAGARNTDKLSSIKKDCGDDFSSEQERRNHVLGFYRALYRRPDGRLHDAAPTIRDFLGEEICNSPVVRDSVLSPDEKTLMDRPITLNELDEAVKDLKLRSAPGPDGISNTVIKKYWYFLRNALHKYAIFSVDTGTLSSSFRTASIKLIPKKGDLSKISNWRPISLLNCIYKVLSKALNNRLKKISTRILSRAQKGFTKGRYIHECIINITEAVSYANFYEIPSFVLALDMAKAFDTIQHDYLHQVYEFFGFGQYFIKMIETFTTGRNACIIWDDNSLSEPFDLENGSGQGNGPSPLQFNFGEQILIFKLELDPAIVSIFDLPGPIHLNPAVTTTLTRNLPVCNDEIRDLHPGYRNECNCSSDKIEAFADDATALGQAKKQSLDFIKQTLVDFAELSGLKCNQEKSLIMPVGCGDTIPECILSSGFKICTEVKILGITIDNKLNKLASNFDAVIIKIINIRNFWSRFRLSIAGRINIAKSLMMGQINYIGCIINPDPQQLAQIVSVIRSFVAGNLKIAANRVFEPAAMNGLGMINPETFILSQQAAWIKKILGCINDNWRRKLHWNCGGNLAIADPQLLPKELYLIANTIAESFRKLRISFYNNFSLVENSNLVCCPLLNVSINSKKLFDLKFFDCGAGTDIRELAKVKICDISENLQLMPKTDLDNAFGSEITLIQYMRLREAFRLLNLRYKIPVNKRFTNIEQFLKLKKKGSKYFREIMDYNLIDIKKERNVCTFFRLLNMEIPEEKLVSINLSIWGLSFIPNKIRDFSFKLFRNSLSVNARLGNFIQYVDQSCTFCKMCNKLPAPRESFSHLFFDCFYTKNLHERFFLKFFPDITLTTDREKMEFVFTGKIPGVTNNPNLFLRVLCITWLFIIWEAKLQKRLLTPHIALGGVVFYINKMLLTSGKLKYEKQSGNYFICREWYRDGE
jgi:exonuclease III